MKVDITVPPVGESVTEATVAQIIKQSGEVVQKDDEILELETDKVNQVVHAPESGLLTLSVSVDQKVGIGEILGSIDTDKASSEQPASKQKQQDKKPPEKTDIATSSPQKDTSSGSKARISEEEALKQLNKPQIEPTKPQASAPSTNKATSSNQPKIPSSEGQKRKRMSGLRKTIAQRLVEVKNQTAMLTTFNEVDMTKVMQIRTKQKDAFEKKHGVKLGFLSFFVTACSAALEAFPDVNAFIDGDEIVYNEHHNIGIAVSTDKGLMVPTLRGCEGLSFAEIESTIGGYAQKAREGKISIDDLQGGTFTITNGGVFGSLLSTPILNPPQSAILGMHKIQKRPIVVDDKIEIRPMMYLALSYDHRIIDGKEAVGFLVHIKESLEDPSRLLLEF